MPWEGLLSAWHLSDLPAHWQARPLREQILWRRGLHDPTVQRRFFEGRLADLEAPHLLPDIEKAVALLGQVIRHKELVFIAGDYDVDGISSAALLGRFLERWDVPYHIRLPTREEGYGLSPAIIEEAIAQRPGLFISVDCGTKNVAEIAQLRAAGIPVLVCDHHTVGDDKRTWPPADAFVNPHRPDASGAYRELSAAGVVFKVLQAYLLEEGGGDLTLLEDLVDIVGVATLADVVPLSGENRLLSRLALEKLQAEPILGYRVLLESLYLRARRLESRDVVFRIVPRLNAVGRLHRPDPALELLLAKDAAQAQSIVQQLDSYNRERQTLQERAVKDAIEMLRRKYGDHPVRWPAALVVANANWHKGIIGLVAAKLTERYERPSAVWTRRPENGVWVASARSVEGVPLHEVLENWCQPYLLKGGGHAMAAGFSAVEEHLRPCSRAFIEGVSHYLKEKPPKRSALDAVVMPAQVREEALDELTRAFEPVGPANPAPRYLLQGVRVTSLDGEKLTIYAADGISNEAFEGRIAFSSYKWTEGWPEVVKRVQGVVVTPFRPWENSAVQLKVRDVIIAPPPGGQ